MIDLSFNKKNKKLYLDAFHRARGAKILPFASYAMPINYPSGIISEHLHTRKFASLFDITHMGQAFLRGKKASHFMESLVPGNIISLSPQKMKYTMLTNDRGGIIDDIMITNLGEYLFVVVNGSVKDSVFNYITRQSIAGVDLDVQSERVMLSLQGPLAQNVLARVFPQVKAMLFMSAQQYIFEGVNCVVSRSGYSGEDGFEISMPFEIAEQFIKLIEAEPEVSMAGLGARDSLRLEAGLCLFGSDVDENITPVEARLDWSISERRRKYGGFPGDKIILDQIVHGVRKKRIGIRPLGRAPARAHTEIQSIKNQNIGIVTSGGFGPTINGPLAMGYVNSEFSEPDTDINLIVRGRSLRAKVVQLPFVRHQYVKR